MREMMIDLLFATTVWIFMLVTVFWLNTDPRFDANHPDVEDRADLLGISPEKMKGHKKRLKSGGIISVFLATCAYALVIFAIVAQYQ